ncbi:MAG TPA: hypothetical protein VKZ76_00570 [Edaphocola sp.]|nr:hypothetical protein [Edaphocola sp.]
MATTRRRKYKSFRSVDALQKAQQQVKREYKDLEENALGNILNPLQIGLSVVPTLFGLFKGRNTTKAPLAKTSGLNLHLPSFKSPTLRPDVQPVMASKSKRSLLQRIFRSLIRWQLFELGLMLLKRVLKKKPKN